MSQGRISASGLLLALLALVVQLAFGAIVPRIESAAALDGATTICHVDGNSHQEPPARHYPADCTVCPLCTTLNPSAFALPAGLASLPPPVLVVAEAVVLPPPTAPPSIVVLAARPRGPPIILT
jgi:hypothetical protein